MVIDITTVMVLFCIWIIINTIILDKSSSCSTDQLKKLGELIMTVKADVLQAVADEKAEVAGKLDALAAQVAVLQEQVNNGTAVTSADFDEIILAIKDITS